MRHTPQLVRQRHVSERYHGNQPCLAARPASARSLPEFLRHARASYIKEVIYSPNCEAVPEVIDSTVPMLLELLAFNITARDALHDLTDPIFEIPDWPESG